MLTTSTWISPNNLADRIKELTEAHEITGYVEIFSADHLGWSDPKQLVQKCWNIEEINAKYREFIDAYRTEYEALGERLSRGEEVADSHCFVEKTKLVHQYRKFLFIDPDLPLELLPELWLGKEADELFQNYYQMLNPGAVRFFETVYEGAPQ